MIRSLFRYNYAQGPLACDRFQQPSSCSFLVVSPPATALVLRRREPAAPRPFKAIGYPVVAKLCVEAALVLRQGARHDDVQIHELIAAAGEALAVKPPEISRSTRRTKPRPAAT